MELAKPAKWKGLPGPDDITRVLLPNGITVLARQNSESASVSMSGYLKSGSLYDPVDKLGLAHFTAQALMRGTEHYTFQNLFDALESVGAHLGFAASVHNTSFGGRALTEDLPLLLELLSECLRKPVFPADQVERLRAQLLTGLAIRNQDTAEMASLIFDEVVFGSHPYGKPEEGHPDTVKSITRDDIVNFHKKHFSASGMVIVVVGGIDVQNVIDQIQTTFGDWQGMKQEDDLVLPHVKKIRHKVRRHCEIPGKSQTDLVMGILGPHRKSSDYMPAMLGNNILGQFGMMGRIGDVVREQAGLAYYASTSLNAWIKAGSWEVSAGINPVNLPKAIDLILAELARFTSEPVTAEELRDSQDSFIGRLPLSMESNAGVANALLNLERFDLGLDYYRRYSGLVEKVTPEIILETARKYLDLERMAIISAGTTPKG